MLHMIDGRSKEDQSDVFFGTSAYAIICNDSYTNEDLRFSVLNWDVSSYTPVSMAELLPNELVIQS